SEEHTSELQSPCNLVCRLLLEKKKENLVIQNGKALHLDLELSRTEYEEMILRLVESTLDSVSKTLADAGKGASDLDAILLVGGSTRTPLISRLLRERSGFEPRQDVH